MGHDRRIDFQRRDGHAAAQDHVFYPAGDGDEAVGIHHPEVADAGAVGQAKPGSVFPHPIGVDGRGRGLGAADGDFAFFTDGAEMLDVTILEIPGVGDWALAQINEPDPTFGIEESVLLVAAGNSKGRVALVPWVEVFPGTPEFDALVDLLELALSRL